MKVTANVKVTANGTRIKNMSESVSSNKFFALGPRWLARSSRLALVSPVPTAPQLTLTARVSRSAVIVAPTGRSMGIFAGCMPKRRSAQSATTQSVAKSSSADTDSAKDARTSGLPQKPRALCAERLSKNISQSPDATTQNPHSSHESKKSTLLPKRTLPCEWRSILILQQLGVALRRSHPET